MLGSRVRSPGGSPEAEMGNRLRFFVASFAENSPIPACFKELFSLTLKPEPQRVLADIAFYYRKIVNINLTIKSNTMKRLFVILSLFALISCSKDEVFETESSPLVKSMNTFCVDSISVTRDAVLSLADSLYGSVNTNIWVSNAPVSASDTLIFNRITKAFSPDYLSWLVIVDMHPMANWGHECTYLFVNASTMETEERTYTMLPSDIGLINLEKSYEPENAGSGDMFDFTNMHKAGRSVSSLSSGNRWAVIISGGGSVYSNYERYWNDCSVIYSALKSYYGYTDNNIYVLMSDGTNPAADLNTRNGFISSSLDLDNDGVADIDYSATRSNISTVFNALGQNVQSGDDVFIYVIDHGGANGNGSYIWLWNNDDISQSEFKNEVDKITTNANVHIVMGQCNSGGFVSEFAGRPNTTIATACKANESSYACQYIDYDEFVYHWTAAVCGEYPGGSDADADYDNDGEVSIYEAFYYANENDVFVGGIEIDGRTCIETPQYASNSTYFGYHHGLTGKLFDLPTLTGPSDVKITTYGVYQVHNLPPSSTLQWQYSSELRNSSSIATSKILTAKDQSHIQTGLNVTATIAVPALDLSIILRVSNITYWKSGISISDDLMTGTITSSGGQVALIENFNGAYGYEWRADNGMIPEFQGYYFTNFTRMQKADPPESTYITVDFYNPFGEQTTIARQFVIQ